MPMERRAVLAAGLALAVSARQVQARPTVTSPVKAVVFDGLALFDASPVSALCVQLAPEKGRALAALWRERQFAYGWLSVTMGQYENFDDLTLASLDYAIEALGIDMPPASRKRLTDAFSSLQCWPDVADALRAIRQKNLRTVILSNFSGKMLDGCLAASHLASMFDMVLSTEAAHTYKPSPTAYQLAVDALGMNPAEILFVAFAGWDAAGAKAFGLPTYWANRQKLPLERLSFTPDFIGTGISELLKLV